MGFFCIMCITLPTCELRYLCLIQLISKNYTNNPLEIYTIQFGFSNRLLCICCADIMSIFVSYVNSGVDVPRAYR